MVLYITNHTNINDFPNALNYLNQFYDKLMLRWAYKNRLCKLYSLSTLRNSSHFESKNSRIFVPYRCDTNKFALDTGSSIGLTDVTAIFLKDNYIVYYLLGVLNSSLIKFYNNVCGKRKGTVYEFFSVPLSDFPIRMAKNKLFYEVVDNVLEILKVYNSNYSDLKSGLLNALQDSIDDIVYNIYCIDEKQVKIIENYLRR